MDASFSLRWPRQLFEWEARRVLIATGIETPLAIKHLLEEAFDDYEVSNQYEREIGATAEPWATPGGLPTQATSWLEQLLGDERRLREYRAPLYWAERHGQVEPGDLPESHPLSRRFSDLLTELQDSGYFPRALPRECVDGRVNYDEVNTLARRATRLEVTLPLWTQPGLSDGALFTLMEYFHDAAQRPRTYSIHSYGECGAHYHDHNRESGGVVYRWRVNELLESAGVAMRLGTIGEEQGRLIRHAGTPLDDLADREIVSREDPDDEVAHAIRAFRTRRATLPERRTALALLFGALEPRRAAVRTRTTRGDESDLFQIANQFSIRHRNDAQRDDYGPEYLDWMFWNALAMVRLMDDLDRRPQD